jgi:CubicO group peptidase (beta-lactamase class C family)
MLGSAGAALLLAPLTARAAQRARLGDIAAPIRAFAEAVLAQNGFPGVSIAFVAPGQTGAFAAGFADLDSRTPATPAHLFQIGSITKSLTGMAAFVLAGQGNLDLDANVQGLLPDVPLPPEPITVRNLLEHSSGLPNSLEPTPFLDVPGGRLWTGFAPGSRYSYCNLGYTLLGMIVERASGMPYAEAMQRLVLRPIGMANAKPVIRTADRALYATGHVRLRDDVPWLPRATLTEGRWLEMHSAAGSVAADARDMVAYLRAVVALGQGKGAPLFSDSLAARYAKPTIGSTHGPGARYGNGLATIELGGRPMLRHTGGMIGFSSAVTVDAAAGIGCYASINVGGAAGYRPIEITEYALAVLRAAAAGEALPAAPQPRGGTPVPDPARFAGRWMAEDGRQFSVAERGGALFVNAAGVERPFVSVGVRGFATDHPSLAPYIFAIEPGEAVVLRLGGALFGKGAAPPMPAPVPAVAALAGEYYGSDWDPRASVHAIGNRLFGDGSELVAAPDGSWRFADPALSPERVWFDNPVRGRPQILNFSGARYSRTGG